MDARMQGTSPDVSAIRSTRLLALLCVGVGTVMVMIDGSIVYVALPTIGSALGLSTSALIWVVNGYAIPNGGLLLLSGRLGDGYGHRRAFLIGVAFFTVASVACGLAHTAVALIAARVVQGAAGAIISTVGISSVMQDFQDATERARATAIYSCVQAVGGTAGLLVGGLVTQILNWRWLFLINLPIGIVLCASFRLIGLERMPKTHNVPLDFVGAALLSTSLLLMTSGALSAADVGWLDPATWRPLLGALGVLALFAWVETRTAHPIIPFSLLVKRNVRVSLTFAALWAGASSIGSVMSALYLQRVLGYNAFELGLAFIPRLLIIAVFSLGLSAILVQRFGARALLTVGFSLDAAGLLFLARTPGHAIYSLDILPGMVLSGVGTGLLISPYFLTGLSQVRRADYGVASALLNSAGLLGGALALAVVAGQTVIHSSQSLSNAPDLSQPVNYGAALIAAALLACGAALTSRYADNI